MNAALLVYKELRLRDSFAVLEDYFSDELTMIPDQVRLLYRSRRAMLEKLADAESVSGDNPKLHKLCDLLSDLFYGDTDPRGRYTCIGLPLLICLYRSACIGSCLYVDVPVLLAIIIIIIIIIIIMEIIIIIMTNKFVERHT